MKKIFTISLIFATSITMLFANGSKEKENESNEIDTLTFNIIDTDKQNVDTDARYQFLQNKFGLDFELYACSLNDCDEKARVWVASNDMPDMMWTQLKSKELSTWVDTGSLKALPSLDNYPNLKRTQDAIKSDDGAIVDGQRYFIFNERDLAPVDYKATQVFMYRKDWAKKLGMYKETYTWEEMKALAKAMIEKDPGNNGPGKTIGITTIGWAYPAFLGLQQKSPYWTEMAVKKDGKYVWPGTLPETLEGIKEVKSIINDGLLWSDQPLAKNYDGVARFNAGQAGIVYCNFAYNNLVKTVNSIRELYPDKDPTDIIGIMMVKDCNDNYFSLQTEDSWGAVCFNADISDAKLKKALSMLDFMASEEGLRLQRYGVEGKDYKIVNGEVEILWDKDDNGNWIDPYIVNSDRILSITQLYEYEKNFAPTTDPAVTELANQLTTYLNASPKESYLELDYPMRSYSAEACNHYNIDIKSKISELLLNSTNLDKDWKNWTDAMQPKVQEVLNELNSSYLVK